MTRFFSRIVMSILAVLFIPVTFLAESLLAVGTAFPVAFLVGAQRLKSIWGTAYLSR